jgi:hypothetical protein
MPNLGQISQFGIFVFGLSVVLNVVMFIIAFVKK